MKSSAMKNEMRDEECQVTNLEKLTGVNSHQPLKNMPVIKEIPVNLGRRGSKNITMQSNTSFF